MASIYKRPDGKWCGQVNRKGKRKSFYGKTKKEVEQKIHKYENDINTFGAEVKATNITLAELMYKYLFTVAHGSLSASTFERYESIYRVHILDTKLGSMSIQDINNIDVQEYLNAKKCAKASLVKIKRLIKHTLDFAIKNNMIRSNAAAEITMPKMADAKEITILDIEEQKKYMEALELTRYKLLFITTLYSGLRRGEAIALKWMNINMVNMEINVCESYKRVKKFNTDGTHKHTVDKKKPKTKKGTRIIPIPSFLNDLLKDEYEKTNPELTDLVFKSANGTHLKDANIRRAQIAVCKNANIRYVSFHSLRHTYATRLIEAGVDVKTVSELLGHSTIELTLNTYVHSTDDTKRSAVNALKNIMF